TRSTASPAWRSGCSTRAARPATVPCCSTPCRPPRVTRRSVRSCSRRASTGRPRPGRGWRRSARSTSHSRPRSRRRARRRPRMRPPTRGLPPSALPTSALPPSGQPTNGQPQRHGERPRRSGSPLRWTGCATRRPRSSGLGRRTGAWRRSSRSWRRPTRTRSRACATRRRSCAGSGERPGSCARERPARVVSCVPCGGRGSRVTGERKMRTSRTLVVAAVAAALLCSLAPPAGAQAERQLTVTGSPVAPGGSFTVSGTGCIDGQPAVALLTADGEAPLATPVPPAADGAGNWSVAITVPSNTRPGRYPVQARCLGAYSGYDGYDGYDGYSLGGGFHESTAHVDVLPPARLPAADGPLSVDPNVVVRGGTTRVTG